MSTPHKNQYEHDPRTDPDPAPAEDSPSVNPGNNFGTGSTLTPGTNFGTNESVSAGPTQKQSEIDKDLERMRREKKP